jgi:hypothetical protein
MQRCLLLAVVVMSVGFMVGNLTACHHNAYSGLMDHKQAMKALDSGLYVWRVGWHGRMWLHESHNIITEYVRNPRNDDVKEESYSTEDGEIDYDWVAGTKPPREIPFHLTGLMIHGKGIDWVCNGGVKPKSILDPADLALAILTPKDGTPYCVGEVGR